jgi:hypothetical protein
MFPTPHKAIKIAASAALGMHAGATFAHEGHQLPGSHWHATDLWGFVAIGVLLAVATWQGRK